MRKAAILFAVVIFASRAAAMGLGFTVGPRFLFPLNDPYEWDDTIQRGVLGGFKLGLDLDLLPGLTVGPYVSGLFGTDTGGTEGDLYVNKYYWSDLVLGVCAKYSIATGSPWQPWISVAPGYGVLGLTFTTYSLFGDYYVDGGGGGFGLDAGIGVDYQISEVVSVGFGADFHLNTTDKLKYEYEGEPGEVDVYESPLNLGFGFDVAVAL
jgi:hypothetical protein